MVTSENVNLLSKYELTDDNIEKAIRRAASKK